MTKSDNEIPKTTGVVWYQGWVFKLIAGEIVKNLITWMFR